jgi:hypothetical protein
MDENPLLWKQTCGDQRVAVRAVVAATPGQCARFPPELFDIIINFLHEDRKTLAACALVCRSWVPASRYHSFSKITLDPWTWRNAGLLLSPANTITDAVQHLVLEKVGCFRGLLKITSRLPNITRLTLRKSSEHSQHFSPSLSQLGLSPFMKNLKSLELVNVCFLTVETLISLLRCCPRLQSLHCNTVRIEHFWPPRPDDHLQEAVVPELKALSVWQSPWLLDSVVRYWGCSIPRLAKLDLGVHFHVSRDPLRLTETLLDAAGPSLQDLRLTTLPTDLCE